MALEGRQEAVDLGDVDPQQQVGIVGGVGSTVRGDAGHPIVNAAHRLDPPFGRRRVPVGGGPDESTGAMQPTPGVVTVVGVVGDPGHGQRVQCLDEQRP